MSRQRVMVLGATGTLGGYLARRLAVRHHVISPMPRAESPHTAGMRVDWLAEALDIDDPMLVLDRGRPDVVVNCVAVTPGSPSYKDLAAITDVNGRFPHRLADACDRTGAYLVHISTDAVFSGARGAYSEKDSPDPIDLYGQSKLLGELSRPRCITLRTTFFGASPTRVGLLDWLIDQRNTSIDGYARYRFSGLWTGILAEAIQTLLERKVRPHGVYHAGGEPISKLRLLEAVNNALDLGIAVTPQAHPVCDRSLDSVQFWSMIGRPTPRFEPMLVAMLPELRAAAESTAYSQSRGGIARVA